MCCRLQSEQATGYTVDKALEVLEEGYSQIGSETILTRLEELRDCYQAGGENGVSMAENAQGSERVESEAG